MKDAADDEALNVLRRPKITKARKPNLPVCESCTESYPVSESDAKDTSRFCTRVCELSGKLKSKPVEEMARVLIGTPEATAIVAKTIKTPVLGTTLTKILDTAKVAAGNPVAPAEVKPKKPLPPALIAWQAEQRRKKGLPPK